ncbi:hypothetical protein [Comamonas sp. NoAH]|uniref:hypothetical protein n=1 Tax=Comamonas halotolerans TaxID=3041496 RepID=UPI0024E1124F|nr:hypothetical protein [Comamonas sp. NoAH]
MFKALCTKWTNRKKYTTFAEMPDSLVAFFAIAGFLVAGFYGYVLGKVLPEYMEIANKVPFGQWGLKGWLITVILAGLGLMVSFFGSVSWRCNGLLRDRWYK